MKIYTGYTWHNRLIPKVHRFKYPVFYYCLDHDDFKSKVNPFLFSINSWNVFSVKEKDLLLKENIPLTDKIHFILKRNGIVDDIDAFKLITTPRFLGYVFNPVNFYYCSSQGHLKYILVEINNTFGHKHTYVVNALSENCVMNKVFHVSPFNFLNERYVFQFEDSEEMMKNSFQVFEDQDLKFKAGVHLKQKKYSWFAQVRYALSYGVMIPMTTLLIGFEAFRLFFFKKLTVFDQPQVLHEQTVQWSKPVFLQRILTGDYLEKIQQRFKFTRSEG